MKLTAVFQTEKPCIRLFANFHAALLHFLDEN